MKPTIYYFYDMHCGWCYAFSPVIKKIFSMYNNVFQFKLIHGELTDRHHQQLLADKAGYILQAIPTVQQLSGVAFGDPYIDKLQNPHLHTMQTNSVVPARAAQIFAQYYPNTLIHFVTEIQHAHYLHGADITQLETHLAIAEKYRIDVDDFRAHWHNKDLHNNAIADMDLCKSIGVNSFPQIGILNDDNQWLWIQKGFCSYEDLSQKFDELRDILKV
jgi:putative protein-disulfide isomerase